MGLTSQTDPILELRSMELDRVLDELHEGHPPREGSCWCCCYMCMPDENDDLPPWVAGARRVYWQLAVGRPISQDLMTGFTQ